MKTQGKGEVSLETELGNKKCNFAITPSSATTAATRCVIAVMFCQLINTLQKHSHYKHPPPHHTHIPSHHTKIQAQKKRKRAAARTRTKMLQQKTVTTNYTKEQHIVSVIHS